MADRTVRLCRSHEQFNKQMSALGLILSLIAGFTMSIPNVKHLNVSWGSCSFEPELDEQTVLSCAPNRTRHSANKGATHLKSPAGVEAA
jgi:hypothetical protein